MVKDKLEQYARRLFRRWQRAVRDAVWMDVSMGEVARRYGLPLKDVKIARRTLREKGAVALLERARRTARRRMASQVESAVLHLSCIEPQWGRKRLAKELHRRGYCVCPMTTRRVLVRHGRWREVSR